MDDLGKIQYASDFAQEEILKRIQDSVLQVKRLTKAQKDALFKTIRYPHLHHDELLKLSKNPIFESAKDYVMQGLSHRLNPFEKVGENDERYTIELKPRLSYADKVLKPSQSIISQASEQKDLAGSSTNGDAAKLNKDQSVSKKPLNAKKQQQQDVTEEQESSEVIPY